MKKFLLAVLLAVGSMAVQAQEIPAYTADELIRHISSHDTIYVINFWATWCVPCVQELPEFNSLNSRYSGTAVKVLLVSLDFKEDVSRKLPAFLERKKITPSVAWLSETDPNVFIPKIDNSWQGSIPATIVVAPGKNFKKFIEGQITEKEISRIVDRLLEH